MKHLLLSLGYGHTAAIPVTDPAATGVLIAALAQAKLVQREGYSSNSRWLETDGEISINFVDSSLVATETETEQLRRKIETLAKDNETANARWLAAHNEAEKLKKQILDGNSVVQDSQAA